MAYNKRKLLSKLPLPPLAMPVLALLSSGFAALGCSEPTTQLVVVVDTDYAVPEELSEVEARIYRRDGSDDESPTSSHRFALASREGAGPARFDVPFSFGVVPEGGDPHRKIAVEVEGRAAGAGEALVARRAVTGFLRGETLRLPMFLTRACQDTTCPEGQTCTREGCRSEEIPPEQLDPTKPGEELVDTGTEGGAPMDGGFDGTDAHRPDAAPDARAEGGLPGALFDDCASECAEGCEALVCESGSPCECHRVACNCELQCPQTGCTTSCRRSGCIVRAAERMVAVTCQTDAECLVDARGGDATVRCEGGSACDVDCRGAASCELDCLPGAACRIRCKGAVDCSITNCMGASVDNCGDGVRVCNADCP